MSEEETTDAAMCLLWRWIEKYGIPQAIYCDKKSVYVTLREPTIEEQLAGEKPHTAFSKACEKLGIELIIAHSPQAKGRIERNHGVYQDRLVKELRLENISTIETANDLLASGFIDGLNKKFSKEPREKSDFHRSNKRQDLRRIFCIESKRTVSNDWIVRYENHFYQILKGNKVRPQPADKVLVQRWLDGSVHLYFNEKELKVENITKKISGAEAA